ncbi:chemotaxis response regulator protein-glutamate methylesterase [Deltaproteobacteria bacterium TL4]
MKQYGVLIADDSALMRQTLKKIIDADKQLFVVGTARDGNDAVQKAKDLRPDVISMDINMPGLDGITALQIIMQEQICPVVMVSSLTQEGAVTTFECLELGAFDFVGKPGGTVSSDMNSVARELVTKLKEAAKSKPFEKSKILQAHHGKRTSFALPPNRIPIQKSSKFGYNAVAIGISTGGPKVIFDVLSILPPDLNAAIFMVQHMPPGFTASFAERLNRNSTIPFEESRAGTSIKPGRGYLAQGGFHMKLHQKTDGTPVIRATSRPEHQFTPSVDVMMESVLEVYGKDTIGVLMTGMGDDGANAMVKIRKAGGFTIAESEESAVVFGMPQQAIARGGADIVVPLWDIAAEIAKAVM